MHFDVQPIYFQNIKTGQKTVEGRIAKEKYLRLKPGDKISFSPNGSDDKISATVTTIQTYPTFLDMLKAEGLATMIPGITTLEEGVQLYESFGTYKQDVMTYGCVAIRFDLNS